MGTIPTQGYVKLDTVLRNLCLKRGDPLMTSYSRMLPYAAEGMADMGRRMDIGSNVKTVTLTRDSVTKRINLPADYIDYIKIGFRHNGNFIALGSNPRMAPLEMDGCGNYSPIEGGNSKGLPHQLDGVEQYVADTDGIPFGIPVWGGYGRVSMVSYGHAGGWSEDGYFRVNKETRTIDFSSDTRVDDVLVRYETTGFDTNGDNEILFHCQMALERYIMYAEKFYSASTPSEYNQANELQRKYNQALMEAIKKVHGSSNREVGDAWRQNKGGAPRG